MGRAHQILKFGLAGGDALNKIHTGTELILAIRNPPTRNFRGIGNSDPGSLPESHMRRCLRQRRMCDSGPYRPFLLSTVNFAPTGNAR